MMKLIYMIELHTSQDGGGEIIKIKNFYSVYGTNIHKTTIQTCQQ